MIAVATPARDSVSLYFAYDLAQLLRVSPEAVFTVASGVILTNLRNLLAEKALDSGASHILFLDSDMRFPPDTLTRLVTHDKAIVGANCRQRTQPVNTARRDHGWIQSAGKHGIEEVDSLGMAVTLIRMDVLERLRPPWFAFDFDGMKDIGEDVLFCHHAREAGLSIWVDHDLSHHVRHIGSIELEVT